MMVGTLVAGVAVWFVSFTAFWIGVGIVIVGAIAGKVLQVMGYGKPREPQVADSAA